jgi:enamine deaminase RidA (YjgF/YER057c/UK114 family)
MSGRQRISSGSTFEQLAGYSRAVVDGDWIFVSGTTGYDYSTMRISADVETQTRQAFRNIEAALAQAGASLDDVVRVRYYLIDLARCSFLFAVFLASPPPPATAVVCGLVDPQMKIEIEVTARTRGASVSSRGATGPGLPGRA